MSSPEQLNIFKWVRVAGVAGSSANIQQCEMSMFTYDGYPGAGAVPTTWANPDRTTAGALGQANPAGGLQRWLTNFIPHGTNNGSMLTLWDRLGHMGGMSGAVTTTQQVNGGVDGTITRTWKDPSGASHIGNEIWLECYSALGGTQATATVTYKNENGVTHTGTASVGGSLVGYTCRLAQTMSKVQLASGDRGVSAVIDVTLSASTGSVGSFGVNIMHPVISLAAGQYSPEMWSGAVEGFQEVLTDACLFFSWFTIGNANAALPALVASMTFVDK